MSIINNTLLLTAGAEGPYEIERSLRLRSSASAFLNRTPSTAGNRKTWTWSGWVKRGDLAATYSTLFGAGPNGNNTDAILFTNNTLNIWSYTSGSAAVELSTTALYRDPSAWYHVVAQVDTTQATSTNRVRLYVNGNQVALSGTQPTQNFDFPYINNNLAQAVGSYTGPAAAGPLDGYLTEINFVDGQALTPSSFGEFNALTGVWQPKRYAGTYGTNGFYLNFKDNASTSALGTDYSGNGNNWTTNNISLTSGVTYDSMIDVPTPYDDGGNGRGNYCVLNPLDGVGGSRTISAGNLNIDILFSGNYPRQRATWFLNSGKWYAEWLLTNEAVGGGRMSVGVMTSQTISLANGLGGNSNEWAYYTAGTCFNGATSVSVSTSSTTNDIVMMALDRDTGRIWWGKNGTWFNSGNPSANTNPIFSNVTSEVSLAIGSSSSTTGSAALNCGQRPFAYTPPTGFKALNTQNLPEPTIVDGGEYFNTVLYTGTGATRSVTGVGFSPDLIWFKRRDAAASNALNDSVRGVTRSLTSNGTDSEYTSAAGTDLVSFDSDGFTVGATNVWSSYNVSGGSLVAWNWRGSDSAAVTNTAGSITSTVSANPTAGFSIVTWTDVGNSANTVGHGLNQVPKVVIWKARGTTSAWVVNADIDGTRYGLQLESTTASSAGNLFPAPTSTVIQTWALNTTMVAYCFSEVAGYSRFGSYTGNGSADGPFVFCGFRPRWVMIKRSSAAGESWEIRDTTRQPTNDGTRRVLFANGTNAEISDSLSIDILSNGFKCRTSDPGVNTSGATYIFMAFAENPFKHALAR